MNDIVNTIADAMNNSLGATLTVFLLSMIPIAEARLAIPFGISMELTPLQSFGWAFLGSSLTVPILLLVFIPVINALSRTKVFKKIGAFLYDKFEKKSQALKDDESAPETTEHKNKLLTKHDLKRMGGTALFVAVPLPLTGVWTGSAVAAITKLGFFKSLIGVIAGNAVACGIITLISYLFEDYVNYITLAFFGIVVIVVIVLIVKLILFKPSAEAQDGKTDGDDKDKSV